MQRRAVSPLRPTVTSSRPSGWGAPLREAPFIWIVNIVMDSASLGQAFLDQAPIPGVKFSHNDYVRVVAGPHSGEYGSLVTVLSLLPEPRFVLELESGFDVEVLQSEIQPEDAQPYS